MQISTSLRLTVAAALLLAYAPLTAQNVGVDVATPLQKLDVLGGMRIGNTTVGLAGSIRWTGSAFEGHDGSVWAPLGGANTAWKLTGNSGTTPGTNFIGTTDNVNLSFRVFNQPSGLIDNVSYLTFFGYQAGMNTTGIKNSAFGYNALLNNASGEGNTAVGTNALMSNTTAYRNTAIGTDALKNNTSGSYNVAVGKSSLEVNTTGFDNTATGVNALFANSSGSSNTAMGRDALFSNTSGQYNTGVGVNALQTNSNGINNTSIGALSLQSNSTGVRNTASGALSLYYTTGSYNAATGAEALYWNTSGSYNTANGYNTLLTNTTGSYNTGLGYNTDVSANNLSNATAVGANAIVNASNKVQIGDGAVTAVQLGTGTNVTLETGLVKITGGTPGAGKVLTDVSGSGLATWVLPATSGTLTGSGTTNYLPKWTSTTALGNSILYDTGFNLGIGTNSPNNNMELVGTNNSIHFGVMKTGAKWIELWAGAGTGLIFDNTTDFTISNSASRQNSFPTETMRITSAGNVGIGTISPSGKLHVRADASGGFYQLSLQSATPSTSTGILFLEGGSTAALIHHEGSYNGGYLEIEDYSSTWSGTGLVIKQDNVGIGTNTPANKLDVEGGLAVGATYSGTSTAPTNGAIIQGNVGIGTSAPNADSKLHVQVTSTGLEGLRVVGSGTQSISDLLPVASFWGNLGASPDQFSKTVNIVNNVTSGNVVRLQFTDAVPGMCLSQLESAYNGGLPYLAFRTSTGVGNITEKMRILANGNVGIGTTVPAQLLDVNGKIQMRTGATTGYVPVSDVNGTMTWTDPATLASAQAWKLTGNALTVDGTNFIGTTDDVPLNIKVNGQKAGRIDRVKFNSFWGYQAGNLNATGTDNTAIGYTALASTTGGSFNTAIGSNALLNTNGSNNSAVGADAMITNTTGYDNTATGYRSLYSNTTGYENTVTGKRAMFFNTTGYQNTANGNLALTANTTGNSNTANGFQALDANTTGNNNTAAGRDALGANVTGSDATAIGFNAGLFSTVSLTAVGARALDANTSGTDNTAVGTDALGANTTGLNNTANGFQALFSNTTGIGNTAEGYRALYTNTTGSSNTANSYAALIANTTGYSNAANGYGALSANTTGYQNTANGMQAGDLNTTGFNNTFLGYNTDASSATLTNATAIGANAVVAASNSLVLGNAANVGIGTSTPDYKLHVLGSDYLTLKVAAPSSPLLKLSGSYNSGNGAEFWQDNTGDARLNINGTINAIYMKATGDIGIGISFPSVPAARLDVNNGTSTVPIFLARDNGTEVMRIADGGNVGIGTTAPTEKLDVLNGNLTVRTNTNGTTAKIIISGARNGGNIGWNNTAGTGHSILEFVNYDGGNSSTFYTSGRIESANQPGSDDGDLRFYTSSDMVLQEVMRMDYTGNVGIGQEPTQKLDVNGKIRMRTGATTGFVPVSDVNGTMTWTNPTSLTITETDPQVGSNTTNYIPKWNGSELVTGSVYDNGDVGIGTSSPQNILHLNEADGVHNPEGLRITHQTYGSGASDGLLLGVNSVGEMRLWNFENTDFLFANNNTEKMRLTSTGFLGIGTGNPTSYLTIHDVLGINPGISFSGSANPSGSRLFMTVGFAPVLRLDNYESGSVIIDNTAVGNSLTFNNSGDIEAVVGSGRSFKVNNVAEINSSGKLTSVDFRMTNSPFVNYVLRSDATGNASWVDPNTLVDGDNLGDHTATQNIELNNNWLSNDGGSEGIIVDNSGNVGIGQTPGSALLDINGTNAGTTSLQLRSGNGSSGSSSNQVVFGYNGTEVQRHAIKTRHNSLGATGNAVDFYVWKYGTDAAGTVGTQQVMTIDGGNGGSVGIGTTAPAAPLDVRRSTDTDGDAIAFGTPTYYMGRLGETATTNKVYIANTYNSDASYIDFRLKGNAESNSKMIIKGDGNVGIGQSNPSATLDVVGTVEMFGAWTSRSANTVYQAATDGFIVAWAGSAYFTVLTDGSNPPTTTRMEAEGAAANAARPNIMCPVRKGDYWKVNGVSGGTPTVWWMPMGQ